VEDLVQFGVLIFFLVVWLLGGSKKRAQRAPGARPRSASREPRATAPPAREAPARPRAASPPPLTQPQPEGLTAILALLRGEALPPEPARYALPDEPEAAEAVPEELRPLESTDALDARTHESFHRQFVDAEGFGAAPKRARQYRLTPKTARDAVVWTAIFARPKGLE
jgi:hypothetical protein